MKATPKKQPRKKERDPVAEMKKRARAEGYTPERLAVRRGAFRDLQHKYPTMYVAYKEIWNGDTLVEPFFIAAAAEANEVMEAVERLPAEGQVGVRIRYMHRPGQALGYFRAG